MTGAAISEAGLRPFTVSPFPFWLPPTTSGAADEVSDAPDLMVPVAFAYDRCWEDAEEPTTAGEPALPDCEALLLMEAGELFEDSLFVMNPIKHGGKSDGGVVCGC